MWYHRQIIVFFISVTPVCVLPIPTWGELIATALALTPYNQEGQIAAVSWHVKTKESLGFPVG